ncbi:hypothetical protein [Actinokineospora sp.]|uniref:hypothetical protein n=1 Tax=Actinokineospora sp. TaxID=1872133 RepID=UPI0040380001
MTGEPRSAGVVDRAVRNHLAMMLTIVHCGTDSDVLALARMETHRLVAAVLTALRSHQLDAAERCPVCAAPCCDLRAELSRALLPVRLTATDT